VESRGFHGGENRIGILPHDGGRSGQSDVEESIESCLVQHRAIECREIAEPLGEIRHCDVLEDKAAARDAHASLSSAPAGLKFGFRIGGQFVDRNGSDGPMHAKMETIGQQGLHHCLELIRAV
jgi:hypothetical protein